MLEYEEARLGNRVYNTLPFGAYRKIKGKNFRLLKVFGITSDYQMKLDVMEELYLAKQEYSKARLLTNHRDEKAIYVLDHS